MPAEIFKGTAPGRLDVMGGIADYSGSLVLQMPIAEQTTVELKLREDFKCNLSSTTSDGATLSVEFDYRDLTNEDFDYRYSRDKLAHTWHGYIIGCAIVLQRKKGIRFTGGDFSVHSQVPLGKGVSSSASLEVATMKALVAAFNVSVEGTQLALLAQEVENEIVGAPCGLMDQLSTAFGERGKLLPIHCQPDRLFDSINIPNGIQFIGIDSGVRHSVGGASYGDVRCAAFMGYTIIAKSMGITSSQIIRAKQKGDRNELPFKGFLSNISVHQFENQFRNLLPPTMSGEKFIAEFGDTIDSVTKIDRETNYPILQSTLHPIYENERVNDFKNIIEKLNITRGDSDDDLEQLGSIMLDAHKSYNACGLGSAATDEIVTVAMKHKAQGIYGAKITGGGSGGTVCLLAVGEEGHSTAKKIHQQFCEKYQAALVFFDK